MQRCARVTTTVSLNKWCHSVEDWSELRFVSPHRSGRKRQDFLAATNDILAAWDFTVCATCGHVSLLCFAHGGLQPLVDHEATGAFWRDVVFGSLLAASTLRVSVARLKKEARTSADCVKAAFRRSLKASAFIFTLGMITRTNSAAAWPWLTDWLASFMVLACLSSLALGSYIGSLTRRGYLREAVAIVGSRDVWPSSSLGKQT